MEMHPAAMREEKAPDSVLPMKKATVRFANSSRVYHRDKV